MEELNPHKFGSWLVGVCMESAMPVSIRSKLLNRLAREVRSVMLRSQDYPIEFTYCGNEILAPLSHELPMIAARYAFNSLNFGGVVEKVAESFSNVLVVDIGANIGDSVVVGGVRPNVKYLCIEGAKEFIPYLIRNVGLRSDVQVVGAIIGDPAQQVTIKSSRGTGSAIVGKIGSVSVKSLATVVLESGWIGTEKILLKIDTDGFDAQIMHQSSDFIFENRPEIFFEYDPILTDQSSVSLIEAIDLLLRAGYDRFEVWDKYGSRLLQVCSSSVSEMFNDLNNYCREASRNFLNETMYFDVWASCSLSE
jgi:FkbM family methyltransferase